MNEKALTLCCLIAFLSSTMVFSEFASANFEPYVTPPIITVTSPSTNVIYDEPNLTLDAQVEASSYFFMQSEKVAWIAYTLDNQQQINLTFNNLNRNFGYTASVASQLTDLSEGAHSLAVFGQTFLTGSNDEPFANFSVTVFFIVGSVNPTINLLSPQPKTYNSISTFLQYTSDLSLTWAGYSLDNGAVVTTQMGSTLNLLSNGPHTVRIYGIDTNKKICVSNQVAFAINGPKPPVVTIDKQAIVDTRTRLPPDFNNKTTWWMLIFNVNEPVAWTGYSLDGAAPVSGGNDTISLPYGTHTVVAYAKDDCGNEGASDPYTFVLGRGEAGSAYASPATFQKPTPSATPPIPELSFLIVVPLLLSVVCVAALLNHRKEPRIV